MISLISSSRFGPSSDVKAVTPVDIAARAIQARHDAIFGRIRPDRKHDGNAQGGSLGCERARCGDHDDHVNLMPDEIGSEIGQAIVAPLRPSLFDAHIPAIGSAHFRESPTEGTQRSGKQSWRRATQESDNCIRLLRARPERPRHRRTSNPCNEIASPHSSSCSL
jgi:hypothetical protein